MDDEERNDAQDSQESGLTEAGARAVNESIKNTTNSTLKKKLTNRAKINAAKHSLLKVITPILIKIGLVVLIIIFVLSVAMFLISMPGMSMEKLKELFNKFAVAEARLFGGDTTAIIQDDEIYEILDYLEEMGYTKDGGLKGYGFLTGFVDMNPSGEIVGEQNVQGDGVVRDSDTNKINNAKSDYIKTYIMSNNYIYTLKNENLVTGGHFWESITQGFSNRVANFGKGMLMLYYEAEEDRPALDEDGNDTGNTVKKGILGRRGDPVNTSFFAELLQGRRAVVDVDSKAKTIRIEFRSFSNSNNPMEFSVDGWTGRYGMPLEFLLSIHHSTMMPDLAVDMFTSFPTNVNIYLHPVSGTVTDYLINEEGQRITASMIKDLIRLSDEIKMDCSSEVGFTEAGNTPKEDGPFMKAKEYGLPVGLSECLCYDNENANIPEDYAPGYVKQSDRWGHENCANPLCDYCYNSLLWLLDNLSGNDDEDGDDSYKTYQPYIASVTDHWYRNVYFALDNEDDSIDWDNLNLVQYDYEYEAMFKERWTLYETDDDDELVLYRVNDEGELGEKFEGTIDEAHDSGIKVAKKAMTLEDISKDKLFSDGIDAEAHPLTDLGWVYDEEHKIWSAYEIGDVSDTFGGEIQEVEANENYPYPDYPMTDIFDILGFTDRPTDWCDESKAIFDSYKDDFYRKIVLSDGVVQVGEGQRGETNPTIKKIFLKNKYFKYDSTKETAEIIAKLREKVSERYNGESGKTFYTAVPEDYMDIDVDFDADEDGEDENYVVKDYVATADITQDSLNSFSMLENTHTLDADFIYRDFKELIVELGYFEKGDLTDETPRLLQWLVPEIGSYGFPKRAIDKNENVPGTMIHSEGDIHAKVKELTKASGEDNASSGGTGTRGAKVNLPNDKYLGLTKVEKKKLLTSFDDRQITDIANTVGATSGSFKKATFLETAKTCWEYVVDAGRYSYAGGAQIPITNGNIVDCSSFVSWCIYEHGYEDFEGAQHDTVSFKNTNWNEAYGWEEIEVGAGEDCSDKLQPGDILVRDNGGGANGHVQIIASIEGDDIIVYDCGDSSNWAPSNRDGMSYPSFAKSKEWPGKIIRIDAVNQIAGDLYKGYKGNEAVVSPVTGILLEYGTYDEDDKDNVTGEEYRTNVDYKYSSNSQEDSSDESGSSEEGNNKIPVDKVGYAKILVLDKQTYSHLEKEFSSDVSSIKDIDGNSYGESSFVDGVKGNIKEFKDISEDYVKDNWTDKQKEIYGYKEFAEAYEKYGIAGNIIYIDGFICEYPEKRENSDSGSEDEDFIPHGDEIKIDDFKEITYNNISISEEGEEDDEDENKKSLYEKDGEYKVASKSVTERLNAEAMIKAGATPTYYTSDKVNLKLDSSMVEGVDYEGIFIKEGTVIGRTMTDKELIKEMRGEEFGTYQELRGGNSSSGGEHTAWLPEELNTPTSSSDEDVEPVIIGNYLRIIMQDENRDVVENVEDYMKLDDGNGNGSGQYFDLEKIDENSSMEDKIRAIVSYFVEQGFSVEGACGICGNLIVESGLDPTRTNSEGYHGLAQWDPSGRWPRVKDWVISKYNNEDSFAGQVRAIYEFEIDQMQSDQWDRLKKTSNVEEGAEMFCVWYERAVAGGNYPGDPTTFIEPGSEYQALNLRKDKAKKAHEVYMGENYDSE